MSRTIIPSATRYLARAYALIGHATRINIILVNGGDVGGGEVYYAAIFISVVRLISNV